MKNKEFRTPFISLRGQSKTLCLLTLLLLGFGAVSAFAVPVPGGTLDPTTIPKYVTPLVIPPVMKNSGTANDYDIAVRQFQQQILPGGVWNTLNGRADAFPATTIWSYGPANDPAPDSSALGGGAGIAPAPNSQFNYPAYTVENIAYTTTTVDWINDLKDPVTGNFLEHITPVDQTLHWANPLADCVMGSPRTDCRGTSQDKYRGPVPIVTHVHGAHVGPESDGYPEAWWLPNPTGSNFLCTTDPTVAGTVDVPSGKTYYMCQGKLANAYGYADNTNTPAGTAVYTYKNDQPSTTLWYHDHSLGMTRNNVYAGPAGFWLIREDKGSGVLGETGLISGILPGPAPAPGETLAQTNFPAALGGEREKYREIPIVIQDRSFNVDGSLFYPANRAFFEGLGDGQGLSVPGNIAAGLDIPFITGDSRGPSDISPIWNPEAFFNVMVVNGVSWPVMEVAPAIYRLRLLNGCNSRFLNLALRKGGGGTAKSNVNSANIPFYQIGAEQSLMPQVVRIETGFATPLPGNGLDVCAGKSGTKGNKMNCVPPVAAADPQQALLMGLAERADVLVDFRGLANGDTITMTNTAPDAPFGGFPDIPADPGTSGQVMQFVINSALLGTSPTDPVLGDQVTPNPNAATPPALLTLGEVEFVTSYPTQVDNIRDLALIEEESEDVCVMVNAITGAITYVDLPEGSEPFDPLDPNSACALVGGVPFAPKAAVLGYDGSFGAPTSTDPFLNEGAQPTLWSDPIATNPALNATESWELWNWTMDAHPIHLHLVKFKVLERRSVVAGGPTTVPGNGVQPWEIGWKDTVIAYPNEVTTVAATFDMEGLYVWHCHIVEHEDNEMMVPYCVGDDTANGCAGL